MSPQPKATPVPAQPKRQNTGGQIAAAVLKYLTDRPGRPLFRAEIATATGFTEQQVRVAMSNLRAHDTLGAAAALETQVQGQVWVWHPNKARAAESAASAKPTRRIFEEIGPVRDGSVIIQDADTGALFRATEM